jgi:hypothetical protein
VSDVTCAVVATLAFACDADKPTTPSSLTSLDAAFAQDHVFAPLGIGARAQIATPAGSALPGYRYGWWVGQTAMDQWQRIFDIVYTQVVPMF